MPGKIHDQPPVKPEIVQPMPPAEPAPKVLSPEEQMALFEKELKENDWGHQPC